MKPNQSIMQKDTKTLVCQRTDIHGKCNIMSWNNFRNTQITCNHTIIHQMNVKEICLQLCTCTWLEIMTCIGVASYLLYNSQYYLAIVSILIFSPLIGFHFAISRVSKDEDCVHCGRRFYR